ncbi:MAG: SDR family oxidoreductase [Betaproteobacteria bacterium]
MTPSTPSSPRRIVITGVSRGLGRALTEGFIQLGHTVIGCGRNAEAISGLQATHSSPHRFDAVDVTDDAQVERWAKAFLQTHGAPDLLINCAAGMNIPAPLWTIPAAEFDGLIDTNIKGVANVIRHVVPVMVAAASGVIANFSSGWGRGTSAGVAPYCASKWAIEGLTRAMAKELPKGMAAVPVDPGTIATDMLKMVSTAFSSPLDSFQTPEEWAKKAVPFFLGLEAKDNGKPLSVP